jgi:hypothetical protein
MAAGGHLFISGNHPVSMGINANVQLDAFRFPIIFVYELDGDQTTTPNAGTRLAGDESFVYKELCLETMDFAFTNHIRRRAGNVQGNCPVNQVRTVPPGARRDHTMRAAIPVDTLFPRLELRPEAAAEGRAYHVSVKGYDAEVYNPPYFPRICFTASRTPRPCFQPIYELECLDTGEPTYRAPVAFWTSAFADRIADAPGAVAARSVVFGFPPVYFKPEQMRGVIEAIVFDEWQLPRQ